MEVWMGVGGWLGGRWCLTVSFIYIVSLGCETPIGITERRKKYPECAVEGIYYIGKEIYKSKSYL